jgi:hypothetical protein
LGPTALVAPVPCPQTQPQPPRPRRHPPPPARQLLSAAYNDHGGIKAADALIAGDGAFGRLRWESGVHRAQVRQGGGGPSSFGGGVLGGEGAS